MASRAREREQAAPPDELSLGRSLFSPWGMHVCESLFVR